MDLGSETRWVKWLVQQGHTGSEVTLRLRYVWAPEWPSQPVKHVRPRTGWGGTLDPGCPWDRSLEVGWRADCQCGGGVEGWSKAGRTGGGEVWRPWCFSRWKVLQEAGEEATGAKLMILWRLMGGTRPAVEGDQEGDEIAPSSAHFNIVSTSNTEFP